MSFCYVLMCHTEPEAVLRLVDRIRALSPEAEVLVRCDRRGLFDPDEVRRAGARLFLSDITASWGAMSFAEAALEALEEATRSGCTHAVLISGQDYPIRNLAEWEAEVRALDVDALLDPLADQPRDHTWRWWIVSPPPGVRSDRSRVRRAVVKVGTLTDRFATTLTRPGEPRIWFGLRRRRNAPPVQPVKCAVWAVYRARAIASIRRRQAEQPELSAFFAHVRTPDEWLAPSLVCDDPELRVGIGPTSAKYFPPGAPNPVWLDLEVLGRLRRTSAAPFARKLPPGVDPAVVAEADRMAARTTEEVLADVVEPEMHAITWSSSVQGEVVCPHVEVP